MKQLLVFLLFLCSASMFAQDVIVKKDGSTIVCRVVELTDSEITYKKWSDLNGSNYVMNRADASAINYQNGKKVNLSEATNLYTPNNQNDGVQQYNDRALLAMDQVEHPSKKAKTKKIIAWTGGVTFALVGIGFFSELSRDKQVRGGQMSDGDLIGCGCLSIAGGILWTTLFLKSAHKYEKQAELLQASSLYQHNIPLSNGSSLSLGADLLRDNMLGQNTLGLGLCYNF